MIARNRKERKTAPRLQSGAAVWTVTAVLDGKLTRGRLAVCKDGRVYFGLGLPKLRPTETLTDEGERLLVGNWPATGRAVTVLVKDGFYQTLKGMVA